MLSARFLLICFALFTTFFFSACTASRRFAEFKTVAHDYKEIDRVTKVVGAGEVTGSSCMRFILFIPISFKWRVEEAIENAIAEVPGAQGLKDINIEHTTLLTLFYNHDCFIVKGKPVAFRGSTK